MNIDYVVEAYPPGACWKTSPWAISPHLQHRKRSLNHDEPRTASHDAGLGPQAAQREQAPLRHATAYEQMWLSWPMTAAR